MNLIIVMTLPFIVRCFVVTACICYVLSSYMPRYEFIDSHHRLNWVTGESERYSYIPGHSHWKHVEDGPSIKK